MVNHKELFRRLIKESDPQELAQKVAGMSQEHIELFKSILSEFELEKKLEAQEQKTEKDVQYGWKSGSDIQKSENSDAKSNVFGWGTEKREPAYENSANFYNFPEKKESHEMKKAQLDELMAKTAARQDGVYVGTSVVGEQELVKSEIENVDGVIIGQAAETVAEPPVKGEIPDEFGEVTKSSISNVDIYKALKPEQLDQLKRSGYKFKL